MATENEMTPKQVMEAVAALGVAVESKSAESKAVEAKITAFLDAQEAKSQAIQAEKVALENRLKDAEEKMVGLEKELTRPNLSLDKKGQFEAEAKALGTFLVKGEKGLGAEELKYIRTDKDTEGGYLVIGDLDRQVLKNITEISAVRQYARIKTVASNRLSIPRRDSLLSTYWTPEGGSSTESNPTYAQEMIPINKLTSESIVTIESLEDSAYDIEAFLRDDVAESMALAEGVAFVTGNGVNRPEGFVNTTLITPRNSGLAAGITFDSILQLGGDLKVGYNPAYFFNRATRVAIQLLKSGDGNYLWQAGNVAAGVPNSINGDPYVILQAMADIAADAVPVAFADLRKGYTIADKPGVTFIRDPYTLAGSGKIKMYYRRRTGGGVVLTEAIKLLKCAE